MEDNIINEENATGNIITANDLFRKDIDVYLRQNSTFDDSVDVDYLFSKYHADQVNNIDDAINETEQYGSNSNTTSNNVIVEESNHTAGTDSSNSISNYVGQEDNWHSDGEFSSTEIKNPNSLETELWIPNVCDSFLPKKAMIFDTVDKGIQFYFKYAQRAGFDARLGSNKKENGLEKYKYVFCARSGLADPKDANTMKGQKGKQKRKFPSQMVNCRARICFKYITEIGKYSVITFVEEHNHELYNSSTVHMSRTRRQLDHYDKTLIWQLNKANVGPVNAHGMVTGFKGGSNKQGAKRIDYTKISRDLNCYMKDTDASLLVKLLENRADSIPDFSFYHFEENSELRGLFWADTIAKRNFKEFSDVISFDATYRTNKYNLIFVPFTGIDNHQRCVTFGAALIAKETEEYYTWVLECFVKAFEKHPTVVVTDQDAAVRIAVEKVLTRSKHRLCMWHIGKKLTDKVCPKVIKETDFRKRIQMLIWNPCIDPFDFEEKWISLIKEYKLEDNKWLKQMYELRSNWIPAYFKDTPLSGLMRTTSRSESENYFFQTFISNTTNLVMFMCKFDSAMDKQRSIQSSSDFNSVSKIPAIDTRLEIEVQGSRFYTHKVFSYFQKEVHDGVWTCSLANCIQLHDHQSFAVIEQIMGEYGENKSIFFNEHSKNFRNENAKQFQYEVKFYPDDETFRCDCMVFEHFGFLCRHVICIMKAKFKTQIPSKYLLRRWQKGVIRAQELEKIYCIGEDVGGCQNMVQDAHKVFADCINMIAHDPDSMKKFIEWQKEIRANIEANPPSKDTRKKDERIASMIGITKLDKATIKNPENVKFKGCGTGGKRLQGRREIAMKVTGKEGRTCTYCKKKIAANEKHDRRTCPVRIEDEKRKQAEMEEMNIEE